MTVKIRTLEDVCRYEPFAREYLGNVYCQLGYDKQIMCAYQSKDKDNNGFYPCKHPLYNFKETDEKWRN